MVDSMDDPYAERTWMCLDCYWSSHEECPDGRECPDCGSEVFTY